MNDNGYDNWKNTKLDKKNKKKKVLIILIICIFFILLLIFLFGYDKSMFDKNKIMEFIGGLTTIIIVSIIIVSIVYKVPKYVPICNNCKAK